MNDKIQRRSRMDLWTPAEKAIYDAMQEVEKAGAHPKLTEAVSLLSKAKETLSDYVDETSTCTNCGVPINLHGTLCGEEHATKITIRMPKEDNIFRRHL